MRGGGDAVHEVVRPSRVPLAGEHEADFGVGEGGVRALEWGGGGDAVRGDACDEVGRVAAAAGVAVRDVGLAVGGPELGHAVLGECDGAGPVEVSPQAVGLGEGGRGLGGYDDVADGAAAGRGGGGVRAGGEDLVGGAVVRGRRLGPVLHVKVLVPLRGARAGDLDALAGVPLLQQLFPVKHEGDGGRVGELGEVAGVEAAEVPHAKDEDPAI